MYHPTLPTNSVTTSNSLGTGFLKIAPWQVGRTCTVSSLVCEVTSGGDSVSVVRLGIYSDTGLGLPGALLRDFGTVDATATGVKETTGGSPVTLVPGNYWVGGVVQGVVSIQPTLRVPSTAMSTVGYPSLPGTGAAGLGYTQTGITGSLPPPFTTSLAVAGQVIRVFAHITA